MLLNLTKFSEGTFRSFYLFLSIILEQLLTIIHSENENISYVIHMSFR